MERWQIALTIISSIILLVFMLLVSYMNLNITLKQRIKNWIPKVVKDCFKIGKKVDVQEPNKVPKAGWSKVLDMIGKTYVVNDQNRDRLHQINAEDTDRLHQINAEDTDSLISDIHSLRTDVNGVIEIADLHLRTTNKRAQNILLDSDENNINYNLN